MTNDMVTGEASVARPARRPIDCGPLGMRIARDGTWYYHGTPIGRKEMVRLFASVLTRRPDGSYWLVTPVEEGSIEVEDVPFLAVELSVEGEGRAARLTFRTNLDDRVTLDSDHPLRVAADEHGTPPYLTVRDGLEARLTRAVYYELAEMGGEEELGRERLYGIWSSGTFFPLGRLDPPA